jgi:hypothetical protein
MNTLFNSHSFPLVEDRRRHAVCVACNDAISSSDYMTSKKRIISEYFIESMYQEGSRGLTSGIIPNFF